MAIVKILGADYTDYQAIDNLINYCIRETKAYGLYKFYNITQYNTPAEILNISKFFGCDDTDWVSKVFQIIIAFDYNEIKDENTAFIIGQEIIKYFSNKFQAMFAVHSDTLQLHIHIVVSRFSFIDGNELFITDDKKTNFRTHVNESIEMHRT